LKQRRDGMWWLQGKLTNTVGAQLNAILEPLAKPRTSSIEGEDGSESGPSFSTAKTFPWH
jgi:hypothetical protein